MRKPARLPVVIAFSMSLAFFLNQVIVFSGLIQLSETFQAYSDQLNALPPATLIWLAVFVAPATEEICFRGLLYGLPLFISQKIRGERNLKLCITVGMASSLLFGIFHGNIVQLVYAFFMGLGMCYTYECCGGLLWSILFHMFANFASVISGSVPVFNTVAGGIILGVAALYVAVMTAYRMRDVYYSRHVQPETEPSEVQPLS